MLENRSVPRATVVPVLGYADITVAGDWLCSAFGFTVRLRIGTHRVQLHVGDGAVILTDRGTPGEDGAYVQIRVEDIDVHCGRARAHGARILAEPQEHPFGEKMYTAGDPFGRRWVFTQSVADVDPVAWGGTPIDLR